MSCHTMTGTEGDHAESPPNDLSACGPRSGRSTPGGYGTTLADYPCDMHLARYNGASTRLYLNVYAEDNACALRFSVCQPCLETILEPWLGHALHQTPAGHWDPPVEGEALSELMLAPDRPVSRRQPPRRY